MKGSQAAGVGMGQAEHHTKLMIVFVVAFLMVLGNVQMTSAQTARLLPTASGTGTCTDIAAYGGSSANPDNRAALAAALNASSGGGACVFFPPGQFTFASNFKFVLPNSSASITLTGAGADVTQLYWPTGGGLTIDYVGAENSVHLRNMSLITGSVGVGSAVVLNQTNGNVGAADNALSELFDVTVRGADGYSQNDYWDRAVEITQISNVNLVGLVISGPGGAAYSTKGIGVVLQGSSNNPAVVFNVTGATFNYLSKGIVYGQQVEGLTVSQSNFVGGDYGIYVPPNIGGLDQLTVLGSQFNCATGGIYVGSSLSNTLFSANLFIVPDTGTGIHLQQAYLYSATGNSFNIGSPAKGSTYPIGIEVGSTAGGGTITGNLFDNMVTAIVLDRTSTAANVQSNEYSNDSTMVKNLGTGNTVGGGTP
ncbi:MAG: glycosyl hydrolase family 28-related protein [Candidatus Sulfotelmatobacter sp.]|jgi:hypothetical protein